LLVSLSNVDIIITQGYICRNHRNEIDNLKRGGSDYTASLIGAAIRAEEIQIWTDIDGMHNNDPRIVKKTVRFQSLLLMRHPSLPISERRSFTIHNRSGTEVQCSCALKITMDEKASGTIITSKGAKDHSRLLQLRRYHGYKYPFFPHVDGLWIPQKSI
jgi:aspartate kinase